MNDDSALARALSACDVFLMPSTAEAFGLMAIEAMGAARPVISFDGTSLPTVTGAPECGITVPMGNDLLLRSAIDALATDRAKHVAAVSSGAPWQQRATVTTAILTRWLRSTARSMNDLEG